MKADEDVNHRLLVFVVTGREDFRNTVRGALDVLAAGKRSFTGMPWNGNRPELPEGGRILAERAVAYLDEVQPAATVEVVGAGSLGDLKAQVSQRIGSRGGASEEPGDGTVRPWSASTTALFVVDARAVAGETADDRLLAVTGALATLAREFDLALSSYSTVVYDEHDAARTYARTDVTARGFPAEEWVLAAEVISTFTDLVQARHFNQQAPLPGTEPRSSLAAALAEFLTRQAGTEWGFHFYTGSVVAKLIEDLAAIARAGGNPVLRGPSEHSLAAGALARWQLAEAPFVLAATSGMVSELRGTLANLRDSQARGFIVFGESAPGTWLPFQGTRHESEDARTVFAAMDVPCLYLDNPRTLARDLAAAFRLYRQRRGPVVLLASPQVLRHTEPVRVPATTTADAAPRVREDQVDVVARMINSEASTLLWQCGRLDEDERALVYRLARAAGAALVDSLSRPGTVSQYDDGARVEEYLGTMSLYGYSPAVWEFLCPGGQAREYDRQALFFLKSRIPDLATPFSEKALHDQVRVVQLTDTPAHVAPFTDIPLVEDLASFLRRLAPRIGVEDWILRYRREEIARARRRPADPLSAVPSLPMTHQYFFARLGELLDDLIVGHGYTYTGFYDVGRGGIAAIRNLPRTGPGFSGWYGRALMGDALQALPAIALTSERNVLGFIGDGAARLVPTILPSLEQQIRYEGARLRGNTTIFYLLNGGFSVIRTYRELQQAANADAQMSLLTPVEPAWRENWGNGVVRHERLPVFDAAALTEALTTPAALNLFSVYLAHDNEGDNIVPAARAHWRTR
ncbi:hypothetical protein [Amycolatopsis thermoflava]|uniref:hypothetical protein n=1 Tax=Amycolatopsis thermoflava TaxID=84480 RepID=UPI003D709304